MSEFSVEEVRAQIIAEQDNKCLTTTVRMLTALLERIAADERAVPVAEVGRDWTLHWVGHGPIAPIITENNIRIGDKLFTRPPAQPAWRVPEGWVLVPREPTEAMLEAFFDGEMSLGHDGYVLPSSCWQAMLVAAPAAPAERAKLLPCPFCGGIAEFEPYKRDGLTLKCESLGCVKFSHRTMHHSIEWLRGKMADRWNLRAAHADMAGEVRYTDTPPTESGWYWHWDGECHRMHFVFNRPGHAYLCTEGEPYGPGQKRNFQAVQRMGGKWSTKVEPPALAKFAHQEPRA